MCKIPAKWYKMNCKLSENECRIHSGLGMSTDKDITDTVC